jgi:hypothetical protein
VANSVFTPIFLTSDTQVVPFSINLDAAFVTGLYVGFTTTNDVNVTVTYR